MSRFYTFEVLIFAKIILLLFPTLCLAGTTDTLKNPSAKTLSTGADSQEIQKLPDDVQSALAVLQKTTIFPICGYVGIAAQMPPEIGAFQVIIKTKNADALFKTLLVEKQIAPRLIGLCGISFTDPQAFLIEATKMKKQGEAVEVMSGCIMWPASVSEIIGPIEQVKIEDNKVKFAPKPQLQKNGPIRESIATGELPLLLRNFVRPKPSETVAPKTPK